MKKSTAEIFSDWAKERYPNDPTHNEQYIKEMSETLSFQMYLLTYRLKEIFTVCLN
jgi:hypothetical protein